MTTTIYGLIQQLSTGDPDTTAPAVLRASGIPSKWHPLLLPVIRDECRRRIRDGVRSIEHRSGASSHQQGDSHPRCAAAPLHARSDLLAEQFYNGTEYVTWADATVADHEGRIRFQQELRVGIDLDIALHEQAISEITAAGVSCLADLSGVAA